MDPIARMVAAGAAGAAGGGDPTYVDDVFSTATYIGNGNGAWNGGNNTVPSGLDFTEGDWLSWIKLRSGGDSYFISDSTQKTGTMYDSFASDRVYGKQTGESTGISAVGTNSYTIEGQNAQVNSNNQEYVSWNFKTAPGFFDIQTWDGNSTAGREISHNLGTVPGMILVKCTFDDGLDGATTNWAVYHKSLPNTEILKLNTDDLSVTSNHFHNTTPTASVFTVGSGLWVNSSLGNRKYIAYLFADDDQSFGTNGDESIIKCGTYTGNGGSNGPVIDLGFEPQFIMVKVVTDGDDTGGPWVVQDAMRNGNVTGTVQNGLNWNSSNGESAFAPNLGVTSTGFQPRATSNYINKNGSTYVYMAIRRPHKPPTAGTDVFKSVLQSTHPQTISVGFPTDLIITRDNINTGHNYWASRLTGNYLRSDLTNTEADGSSFLFDLQNEFSYGTFWGSGTIINHYFKRAPGVFDVVAYTGTGSLSGVNHNLGVTPQLKIIKSRSDSYGWIIGGSALLGEDGYRFIDNGGVSPFTNYWDGGDDSATQFSVRNGNNYSDAAGETYVAFLFASLSGISKVGTYTGTGSNINVDCGFDAGARFVVINRAGVGDPSEWYVWDSTRGIVGGNDPYLRWNRGNAPITNTDYIDPLNAGFTVTSSAPATLNANGGNYIFIAIA